MGEGLRVVRGSEVFLGLDISKASWQVTARSGGETVLSASFPPKREALNGLLQRLKGCRVHSLYETGPFGYGLHDWLRSRRVDSMVVSAAHVPGEIGNRVKTDRRDGLKLARTLEAGLLRPIFRSGSASAGGSRAGAAASPGAEGPLRRDGARPPRCVTFPVP
jgi:transposase